MNCYIGSLNVAERHFTAILVAHDNRCGHHSPHYFLQHTPLQYQCNLMMIFDDDKSLYFGHRGPPDTFMFELVVFYLDSIIIMCYPSLLEHYALPFLKGSSVNGSTITPGIKKIFVTPKVEKDFSHPPPPE